MKPPCENCITLAMCRSRCQRKRKSWQTTDHPFIISTELIPICDMVMEYLDSHPRTAYEYETEYCTEVIQLMGLR